MIAVKQTHYLMYVKVCMIDFIQDYSTVNQQKKNKVYIFFKLYNL